MNKNSTLRKTRSRRRVNRMISGVPVVLGCLVGLIWLLGVTLVFSLVGTLAYIAFKYASNL